MRVEILVALIAGVASVGAAYITATKAAATTARDAARTEADASTGMFLPPTSMNGISCSVSVSGSGARMVAQSGRNGRGSGALSASAIRRAS